jgi:hypothetical protein
MRAIWPWSRIAELETQLASLNTQFANLQSKHEALIEANKLLAEFKPEAPATTGEPLTKPIFKPNGNSWRQYASQLEKKVRAMKQVDRITRTRQLYAGDN